MQRTDEWFKERLGKVTASRISDVMAKTKTGYGAGRKNYMAQLLVERLTGLQQESYSNAAMQWGVNTEEEARNAYAFFTGNSVDECGFIPHPTIPQSGASPDGLVGSDGLVEIKCPNSAQHIETLLGSELEDKYIKQMQWQMRCTDRKWCDFVSYDPRLPGDLQMKIQRVERDDAALVLIEAEVLDFLGELEKKEQSLRELNAAA